MMEGSIDNPGIRYVCQRCGNCCRWPGEVVLEDGEVERIAEFLKMDLFQFVRDYTDIRQNRQGLTLIEKPNGECIFLEGKNTCLIQEAKPIQCSGFPNTWNFPGWQDSCEAIPVPVNPPKPSGDKEDCTPAGKQVT